MNALRMMKKMTFLSPRHRIEWYPPFFFMRVKVLYLADDWSEARLRLPLNVFSKNMGDAMFGGYIACLADPIAALACVKRFPGTDVWTRSSKVDFIKPGNSHLELRFKFDEDIYNKIEQELKESGKSNPTFEYSFYRSDGQVCAKVINTIAIRPENYLQQKRGS